NADILRTADAFDQFEAVHTRHAEVGDEDVRAAAMKLVERVSAGVGGDDDRARLLEDLARQGQCIVVVVDDQNADATEHRDLQWAVVARCGRMKADLTADVRPNTPDREFDAEG